MYPTTTIDLKVLGAQRFKDSISLANSNTTIYFTYGKVDAWANEPTPQIANNSVAAKNEF